MEKRKRRSFTKEYKAEVVDLIRKGDKKIGLVCRDLGLTETAVRRWVKQAEIDTGEGPAGALLHESISSRPEGSNAGFILWSRQTAGDHARTSD